jgi:hypothetical protein
MLAPTACWSKPTSPGDHTGNVEYNHLPESVGAYLNRPVNLVIVHEKADGRGVRRTSCDQNWHDRNEVTRFVKVLQVECVIPDLVNRRSIKRRFANLKLDDKNHCTHDEDNIDSTAHARNVELQEHRTG